MMNKKVIGLLTVAVLLFAMTAGAAETTFLNPTSEGVYPTVNGKQADNLFRLNECENCKCPDKNVPCPQTITTTLEQGKTDTQITEACPFDYDDNYGYCATTGTGMGTDRNCRVIFEVCSCPQACQTTVGSKVGIQMTILTSGVYWAKDAKTWDDTKKWNTVKFGLGAVDKQCSITTQDRSFGEIKYYRNVEEKFNSKGKFVRIPKDEGTPVDANCLTTLPPANKVTVIQSVLKPDQDYDYTIKKEDSDIEKCKFWIDMPAMRLDGTAKKGDAIKVRITLLWDRVADFCEDCNPPIMCECERTVGIVCCDELNLDKGCVFFPYVIQGLETDTTNTWVTGIGISARERKALPADAYCILTVQDTKGTTATYKKTDMGNSLVWSFVLERIISNFDKALAPGVVSLKVESNYRIDGYAFLMNQKWQLGAGEMARSCEASPCNP